MVQATQNVRRLSSELTLLKHEVRSLRSLLVSVAGEDREGLYRPEFVRELQRAARQKPTRAFRNARSFLDELRRA